VVKAMHKALYRDNLTLAQAMERMATLALEHPASAQDVALMNDFLRAGSDKRGIVR
jgi:UDP-N-acetylglucosamine acyltransferase